MSCIDHRCKLGILTVSNSDETVSTLNPQKNINPPTLIKVNTTLPKTIKDATISESSNNVTRKMQATAKQIFLTNSVVIISIVTKSEYCIEWANNLPLVPKAV